jgi:hypothetical protein
MPYFYFGTWFEPKLTFPLIMPLKNKVSKLSFMHSTDWLLESFCRRISIAVQLYLKSVCKKGVKEVKNSSLER